MIFGGEELRNGSAQPANTVEFTPATNSWRQRASMIVNRVNGVGAFAFGRFFVFGGTAPGFASAPVDGSIIYLSGSAGSEFAILRFDASQAVWLDPIPVVPGSAMPWLMDDGAGEIYGFGGANTSFMGRPIFRYSLVDQAWTYRGLIPPRFPLTLAGAFRQRRTAYLINRDLSVLTLDLDSFQELRVKEQ